VTDLLSMDELLTELVPRRRCGRRKGSGKPAPERFRAKVDVRGPDDCWPWKGSVASKHPCFRVDDTRRVSPCAYAAELFYGYPGPKGKETQHTHPGMGLCCNPAHLIYGIPGQSPGRLDGEASPAAKLTDRQVAEIRRRAGEHRAHLAREFGVSQGHLSRIIHRRTRKHPTDSPEPRRPLNA
jgi:hypothetical protein